MRGNIPVKYVMGVGAERKIDKDTIAISIDNKLRFLNRIQYKFLQVAVGLMFFGQEWR